MRHVVTLAMLLSFHALAQDPSGRSRVVVESQPTTASASTLSTQGMPIFEAGSCRLLVCAPTGYTLTGGTMSADLYDVDQASWVPLPSSYSETLSTGSRCSAHADINVGVSSGRLRYRTTGVTYIQTSDAGTGEADGGPPLVVQTKCWLDRAGGRQVGAKTSATIQGADGGTTLDVRPEFTTKPIELTWAVAATFDAGGVQWFDGGAGLYPDGGAGVFSALATPTGMRSFECGNHDDAGSVHCTCGDSPPVATPAGLGRHIGPISASGITDEWAPNYSQSACPVLQCVSTRDQASATGTLHCAFAR